MATDEGVPSLPGGQPPAPPEVFGGMSQRFSGMGRRKGEEPEEPLSPRHSVEPAGTGYSLSGCASAETLSASPIYRESVRSGGETRPTGL